MGAPKGNKYALGNKGGRPPKYSDPLEMEQRINEYFDSLKPELKEGEDGKAINIEFPTLTGLALFLGFASRDALSEYQNKKEFSVIVKRARSVVEHHYESRLNYNGCTGAIFALKNMGWEDKRTEVRESTENISISMIQWVKNAPEALNEGTQDVLGEIIEAETIEIKEDESTKEL